MMNYSFGTKNPTSDITDATQSYYPATTESSVSQQNPVIADVSSPPTIYSSVQPVDPQPALPQPPIANQYLPSAQTQAPMVDPQVAVTQPPVASQYLPPAQIQTPPVSSTYLPAQAGPNLTAPSTNYYPNPYGSDPYTVTNEVNPIAALSDPNYIANLQAQQAMGQNGTVGPMSINGMPFNPNVDTIVPLKAKPTWCYCKHCNCMIQSKLRPSKFNNAFIVLFIIFFISVAISGNVIPDFAPFVFFFFFAMFFILACCQPKPLHYCPNCNTDIGFAGESVTIPAANSMP